MSPTWRNGITAFALGLGVQWVSDAPFWRQAVVIVGVVLAYFWVQAGVEAEARRLGRRQGLEEARRIAIQTFGDPFGGRR